MFLSTPPSRVATLRPGILEHGVAVSIHATLAGGDDHLLFAPNALATFLSTPPSRVATLPEVSASIAHSMFLSTPPSRVAT